jgi:hypothetical protein
MPRITAFLVFFCWIASVSGIASAQSVDVPRCDPKQVLAILHNGGQFPDVRGCRLVDIAKAAERFDYRVRPEADKTVSGIERGIITESRLSDGIVFVRVSTGAGYPPPAPPAPATQLCPDGSQIPATETCPDPAPPPPEVVVPPIPAAIPAPPPPNPPPPPANHDPAPDPLPPADSDCYQYQMAMFRPPRFTISAPADVREGNRLTLTIRRDAKECRPHKIGLTYDHGELLTQPPTSIDFPASADPNADQDVIVTAARGPVGDGDHFVTISLSTGNDAAVGDPGSVTVRILDTIVEPPTSYTVVPPENVGRGQSLTFRIERTGGTLASETIEYEIRQGKDRIFPDGLPHPLKFAPGETSKTLTLLGQFYSVCDPAPTITLNDGSGFAKASFSGSPPRSCNPIPWWLIAGGVLALGAIAYGIRKIFFPPVPILYPTWDVEPGLPLPALNAPRIPGWPRFSTETEVEWGGAEVPQPLPIAEKTDG